MAVALVILFLVGGVGGTYALWQTPLAHSVTCAQMAPTNHNGTDIREGQLGVQGCGPVQDPTTNIWKDNSTNINGYNTLGSASYLASCGDFGSKGCYLLNSGNGQFSGSGPNTLTTDCGSTFVASCTDPPPSHNIFEASNQVWAFEPGACGSGGCTTASLNWTTTTFGQAGPWTEHGQTGSGFDIANCGIGESTELSVTNNGTFVFVWITPRSAIGCFNYGRLGANGAITWQSWQEGIISTSQAQDSAIGYDATDGTVYLFFACANVSCGLGHSQGTANWLSSTNSKLNVWNSPQILEGSDTCANDFQADITPDVQDPGEMMISYTQFYSMSPVCTNGAGSPLPHWFTREVRGVTQHAQVQVPDPSGFGNLGFWSYTFYDSINTRMTGVYEYAVSDANATFRYTPLFATYTADASGNFAGTWSQPSLGSNTIAQLESKTGLPSNGDKIENLLQCVSYSQSLGEYAFGHQVVGGTGSQINEFNMVVTDNNFNVLNATSAYFSLGTYGYSGSGSCEKYVGNNAVVPFGYVVGSKPGTWKTVAFNMNIASGNYAYNFMQTTNPIGDVSIAVGKELEIGVAMGYFGNANCCGLGVSQPIGFFLRTNATIPKESLTNYNPMNDPSVALLYRIYPDVGGKLNNQLFLQKQTGQTLASEDSGDCNGLGSCYANVTNTGNGNNLNYLILNYTGSNGVSNGCKGVSLSNSGAGCSYIATDAAGAPQIYATGTNRFPTLNIQGGTFYFGLWTGQGVPEAVEVCVESNTVSCSAQDQFIVNGCFTGRLQIDYCIPQANVAIPTSNTDSSGFFGAAGRFLVSAGIQIITALVPAANIVWVLIPKIAHSAQQAAEGPFLAALYDFFQLIVSGLVGGLNAIGAIFGLPSLGTYIQDFFTGVVNWFLNILIPAFLWFTTIASVVGSGIAFITNIFSNSNPFIAQITGFFQQIPGIIGLFGTYWNIFLYWFSTLTNAIQYLLVGMWIWFLYTVAEADYGESTNKVMEWAGTIYRLTGLIFEVAEDIIHFTTFLVVSVKQLVAGWV